MRFFLLLLLAMCAMPAVSHAFQVCELDGQSINPNNGHTTAGKSGLMRCREGKDGPIAREQELKNGVFMGLVRYHHDGELKSEFSVNERGNKEGRYREFDGSKVVTEETYRNGDTVGLSRRWYPSGQLKRVTFHGDDGRDQASAEFTRQGKLHELRCAAQPLLAPDADDAAWCGHGGKPGKVTLYGEDGRTIGMLVHEQGARRLAEQLWDTGKPRQQLEAGADGSGAERRFYESGAKRSESEWATRGTRRIPTLQRTYHESGSLVLERKWKVTDKGGLLQLEQRWWLNGQLKEKLAYADVDGEPGLQATEFHENGRVAVQGLMLTLNPRRHQPVGVHKRFDKEGRLSAERHHDKNGQVVREVTYGESGQVTRDEKVFEDGSRKPFTPG